ncbi:hypothetical protein VZT92_005584 [Zoarces viviparus]|uniref:Uncharacterized protein n=1 Tax=Zoarces viviparus TaxID=48416 RepID=A0AAW1FSV0_ZOAVI
MLRLQFWIDETEWREDCSCHEKTEDDSVIRGGLHELQERHAERWQPRILLFALALRTVQQKDPDKSKSRHRRGTVSVRKYPELSQNQRCHQLQIYLKVGSMITGGAWDGE